MTALLAPPTGTLTTLIVFGAITLLAVLLTLNERRPRP